MNRLLDSVAKPSAATNSNERLPMRPTEFSDQSGNLRVDESAFPRVKVNRNFRRVGAGGWGKRGRGRVRRSPPREIAQASASADVRGVAIMEVYRQPPPAANTRHRPPILFILPIHG
jgi:hypothetical protein